MRWRLSAVLVPLFILAFAPAAGAVQVGGQLLYGDDTDLGLGARLEVGTSELFEYTRFQGDFNWYFPDDGNGVDLTFWEIDGNLLYAFDGFTTSDAVSIYAGGGLNLAHASVDFTNGGSNSDTDLGVNLLGGLNVPLGQVSGFAEMRITLSGSEQYTLAFGLLF